KPGVLRRLRTAWRTSRQISFMGSNPIVCGPLDVAGRSTVGKYENLSILANASTMSTYDAIQLLWHPALRIPFDARVRRQSKLDASAAGIDSAVARIVDAENRSAENPRTHQGA